MRSSPCPIAVRILKGTTQFHKCWASSQPAESEGASGQACGSTASSEKLLVPATNLWAIFPSKLPKDVGARMDPADGKISWTGFPDELSTRQTPLPFVLPSIHARRQWLSLLSQVPKPSPGPRRPPFPSTLWVARGQ